MMDNLFNDMEQNRKLEEMEEELERQREAVLKEAMKQYQDAAMEGDPRAQYALAHAYFQAQDYVTSLSWWNQAAKKGLTCAWTRVALQYAYGLGVDPDQAMAMDCLWKAIHGDPEDMNALAYLGMFYEQGIGVEKNGASPRLLPPGGGAQRPDGAVHLGNVLFLRQRRGGRHPDSVEMGQRCGRTELAGGTVFPGPAALPGGTGGSRSVPLLELPAQGGCQRLR